MKVHVCTFLLDVTKQTEFREIIEYKFDDCYLFMKISNPIESRQIQVLK